jgi:glucose-6-phosphate-specific signal transduction histidine kinase
MKVRRHADLAEQGEEVFGNAVVEHALAGDRALLLRVERGRIVLEILDEGAGLGPS